jgi:hypothetical protein
MSVTGTMINGNICTGLAADDCGTGIANDNAASVMLKNTIVAENTAGAGIDLSSATAVYSSNGYNLIGQDDTNVFATGSGDQEGTVGTPIDPLFGLFGNNGGLIFTLSLLPGSPA